MKRFVKKKRPVQTEMYETKGVKGASVTPGSGGLDDDWI